MSTTATAGIMARLREETWPQHQKAESQPVEQALASGRLSLQDFVRYLSQRYFIHRALESGLRNLCESRPDLRPVIDENLFQETNLVADLKHFGQEATAAAALPATLALVGWLERAAREDAVALLGCNYVLEGSKNGARFIAKRMSATHGLKRDTGLAYLDPHGEAQRPLWQDYKSRMDACNFSPDEQDRIIAAARQMFDAISAIDAEHYAQMSHPTPAAG